MPEDTLCFASEADHRSWVADQATLPRGFKVGVSRFAFEPVELPRKATMAISVIACDRPTPDFAAVFTRNAFPGAPVMVGRRRLACPTLGALVINNKISNVGAPDGLAAAEAVCAALAERLGIAPNEVMPASTGVIGWRLPVEAMRRALPAAVGALQGDSLYPAAEAIMTTDLYPKVRRVQLAEGSIVGIAKGAGMIEPNLATMLVFILTDLAVPREALRQALHVAVADSFNAISIDSDQSTSDTVALLSSGRTPCPDHKQFTRALTSLCQALAGDVVRNGEGVRHVLRVKVAGAPDVDIAKGVGKSVVNSPLVQCAMCGNDPNVGRLLMAVGKYLGELDPPLKTSDCRLRIAGEEVFANSVFTLDRERERRIFEHLKQAELYATAPPDERGVFRPPIAFPPHERCVEIAVDLACGQAAFQVLGADRTHEYISENADYRS